MKILTMICGLLLLSMYSSGQRYTTKGIEIYDKNLNGTYRLVGLSAALDATFGFYKDNTLVKVIDGEKVELEIKKKVRTKGQTVYTVNNYIGDIKIVVEDSGILTLYTDSQKWRLKIVKIEKDID